MDLTALPKGKNLKIKDKRELLKLVYQTLWTKLGRGSPMLITKLIDHLPDHEVEMEWEHVVDGTVSTALRAILSGSMDKNDFKGLAQLFEGIVVPYIRDYKGKVPKEDMQWAHKEIKEFFKNLETKHNLLPPSSPKKLLGSFLSKIECLSSPEKYTHINFTPPKGAQQAAKRGLELLKIKKAATPVGIARARDLVNGKKLSPLTVKRMFSFFARHEIDKKSKAWKEQTPTNPSKGYIAWLLWGGDPGYAWARKIVKQMKAADAKE